jgi:hypothetical protein
VPPAPAPAARVAPAVVVVVLGDAAAPVAGADGSKLAGSVTGECGREALCVRGDTFKLARAEAGAAAAAAEGVGGTGGRRRVGGEMGGSTCGKSAGGRCSVSMRHQQ